jgi:hypothetical protein
MAKIQTPELRAFFSSVESAIAKVVIEDTIYNAFTDIQLHGDETIKQCLELLLNNESTTMIQGILAQYIGNGDAADHIGVEATLDPRLLIHTERLSLVTEKGLEEAMISQLEQYFSCPQEMRQLLAEKNYRCQENK